MNTDKDEVLLALRQMTRPDGEMCSPFLSIEQTTGLPRKRVRTLCRLLTRQGLAEYHRGLWRDDGPAGAGYCISRTGLELSEERGND